MNADRCCCGGSVGKEEHIHLGCNHILHHWNAWGTLATRWLWRCVDVCGLQGPSESAEIGLMMAPQRSRKERGEVRKGEGRGGVGGGLAFGAAVLVGRLSIRRPRSSWAVGRKGGQTCSPSKSKVSQFGSSNQLFQLALLLLSRSQQIQPFHEVSSGTVYETGIRCRNRA